MKKATKSGIAVIGAGIGGAASAALLAAGGYDVTLFEAQDRPGGCASTFRRGGFLFDAGATVGCGFHSGGPLAALGRDLDLEWHLMPCRVAWEYVSGDLSLPLTHSRMDIVQQFPRSVPFWREQEQIAASLWSLAGEAVPWPPASFSDVRQLVSKALSMPSLSSRLARFAAMTVRQWLARHQLHRDEAFVRFLDAQLLISLQTTTIDANALFGAVALDLPVRGTHRLTGGIGQVVEQLTESVRSHGGRVLQGCRVNRLQVDGGRAVAVITEDEEVFEPRLVIANLTPRSLAGLVEPSAAVRFRDTPAPYWSAFMLYLGVHESAFSNRDCAHLQIVEPSGEPGEGRSVFVSVSPSDDSLRAPEGFRAVTISTHTRPEPWFQAAARGNGAYESLRDAYTEKVFQLLETRLPGLRQASVLTFGATPVTWQTWTGREGGYVGGCPQTSLFRVRGPHTSLRNLFLVGDSVFPGQSLPGVVSGARRLVGMISRRFKP
ncbi:FAD-dependent oxidoreductase [Prosthecochloris sp. N3]|uniref:FAD-dependent oxidoreductase n=1 Tax=Prosthecochloris ethylica TaxID=2743976 RepID=A0ABR9XRT1_9CHLB|nr:FAD-dependent oxidoreductase [Prosthecochloris sp. ZM_2]MBF0586916.1 FAD-dependent oxidoreductase [Prosthecochloris ethylica]MBF0636736.1 FAD-dependent oxidoreductase [Prosthecochloris ethylica]NUK48412.1 FAD-dependent oxidoreductase [Prosthecochloris ethylica]RNA64251.1 FAD-dependent oxidoreductase [Prosthecochloris sp. ZM_2]